MAEITTEVKQINLNTKGSPIKVKVTNPKVINPKGIIPKAASSIKATNLSKAGITLKDMNLNMGIKESILETSHKASLMSLTTQQQTHISLNLISDMLQAMLLMIEQTF